jgi:penicillin-binding protein 1A
MTLEELTCAYAVFANQGERMPSSAIRSVQDKAGRLIWQPAIRREAVMSEAGAAIMVDMLRGVVAEGTGRHARKIDHPVGGKTGTTNSCRDALFVGFSPTIAAGVWVGCDDYRSLGPRETGGRAALPIWAAFMESALAGQPFSYFPVPDGLVKRYMDPDTGDVYNSSDRAAVAALFREERQGN